MWPPSRPGIFRAAACTATTSAATSSTSLPTAVATVAPAPTAVAAALATMSPANIRGSVKVSSDSEYDECEVGQMGEMDDIEDKPASSKEGSRTGDTAATSTE